VRLFIIKPQLKIMPGDYLIFTCLCVFGFRWLIRDLRHIYKKLVFWLSTEYKQKPWLLDYAWNEEKTTYRGFNSILPYFKYILLTVTIAVSIYELSRDHQENWGYLIAVFLLAFYLIWKVVKLINLYQRYGKTILHYKKFPFYLGKELKVLVEIPKGVDKFPYLEASLSCYREGWITERRDDSTGKTISTSLVITKLHSVKYKTMIDSFSRSDKKIPITFLLDTNLPTTNLISLHPTYWELNLSCKETNYEARFLLPIYTK
jgi:hypothetical protein